MECNTPESLFEISISRILLSTRQLEVPPWCLCTLLGTTVRLGECHRGWSYCLPSFPVFFYFSRRIIPNVFYFILFDAWIQSP